MFATTRNTTAKSGEAKVDNVAFWNAIAQKNDELARQYRDQAAAFTEKMKSNPHNRAFINGYSIASRSANQCQSLADMARLNAANFAAAMEDAKSGEKNIFFRVTSSLFDRFSLRNLTLVLALVIGSIFSLPSLAQNCAEGNLFDYFGKNRLMIGAQDENRSFFQGANAGLTDVRYRYIADMVSLGDGPCMSCADSCSSTTVIGNGNTWNTRWWGCWNTPAGQFLKNFLNEAEADGQIPMITYYTFYQTASQHPQLGGTDPNSTLRHEGNLAPLTMTEFLPKYFNDFRFMLQQMGDRKAILHIEPDLWGYGQQRYQSAPYNGSPNNIPAIVKQANPTDCGGFENSFAGFSRCLIHMVRKYAPNTKVGLHASAWATGADLNLNRNSGLNIESHAQQTGNYLKALGSDETDFMVVEASDRDAGYYYTINDCRGNPRDICHWWDENDQRLPHFEQHFRFTRELGRVVGKPLVWWQLPVGNRGLNNTNQRYQDNRVDYLLNPANADKIVDMGGMLLAFGAGAGNQTNPSTDNGNLANRIRQYKQSTAGRGYCKDSPEPPVSPPPVITLTSQGVVPTPRITPSEIVGLANYAFLFDNINRDPPVSNNFPLNQDVAFRLPQPLNRVLFQWSNGIGGQSYTAANAGGALQGRNPASYRLQYSTNSTNGSNGNWVTVADVTDNGDGANARDRVTARSHLIDAGNNKVTWVRFRIGSGNIAEIDIHDLSGGSANAAFDTWGFVGDSLTEAAYWRETVHTPFNTLVPGRAPSMLNMGIGGISSGSDYGLGGLRQRIGRMVELNEGIHFWAIGIGTNNAVWESWNPQQTEAAQNTFRNDLNAIVDTLLNKGKQPIIARIPFTSRGSQYNNNVIALNAVVDEVTRQRGLPAGPDLYAHFEANRGQLTDGVHTNYAGRTVMNELWAKVASKLSEGAPTPNDASSIQRAYIAFFNRPADVPGMNHWKNYPGNAQDLLTEFSQSAEYLSDYAGLNNQQIVSKVYLNLFGRLPEPAGLNYWTGQMNAGWVSVANVAHEVLGGARNEDATIIQNKVTASNMFTDALNTPQKIEAYNRAGEIGLGNAAKEWLAAVNERSSSLNEASSKLNALINQLVNGWNNRF